MENQVLIVVLEDNLRASEIIDIQTMMSQIPGVKMVKTIERVIYDGLREEAKS